MRLNAESKKINCNVFEILNSMGLSKDNERLCLQSKFTHSYLYRLRLCLSKDLQFEYFKKEKKIIKL